LKKFIKWAAISFAAVIGIVVLAVAGFFIYLNYEGPQTEEQKNSLDMIHQLNQAPALRPFTGKVSDEKPEIYDDRKVPEGFSTSEKQLEE